MNDIRELVKRLEAATGPRRELDAIIHPTEAWYDEDHDEWRAQYGDTSGTVEVPYYTASLDAALSLMPPDCVWWEIRVIQAPNSPMRHFGAHHGTVLASVGKDWGDRGYSGNCNSAPIALCIAALKARVPEAQS